MDEDGNGKEVRGQGQPIQRRTLMKLGTAGAALAVVGVASASPSQAKVGGGGKRFILDVDTKGFADIQGYDGSAFGGAGAFYVSGMIMGGGDKTTFGNEALGTFHCWGFIRSGDGLGVVSQEFDIGGRGKIQISGVESDAPRAVTGGTDDFAKARGQGYPDVVTFDFNNTGRFRIKFRVKGASGPPIL